MSSKRLDEGSLDLGAQFFTARDPRFREFLEAYAGQDSYAPWQAEFRFQKEDGSLVPFHPAERFVGVPRMSAITRRLAAAIQGQTPEVQLQSECRIARVRRQRSQWHMVSAAGASFGPFDALIVTAPPVQAADLMADYPAVAGAVAVYAMEPCWAVACGFEHPLGLEFDAISCRHPALGWAARDSSKPQRQPGREWWVIHGRGDWSREHRNDEPQQVIDALSGAFREHFGVTATAEKSLAHRWLYAKPTENSGPGCLTYDDLALGFCGDWLSGGRVEGAFQSAEGVLANWRRAGLLNS